MVTDFDGPDFFRTMGIQLQQGRDFATSDNDNAPKVAVINESMARRYWPKGNALGSNIVVNKIQRQIVGVVHDFAYHSPDNTDPNPVVFLPMLQGKSGYGYAIIAVHARAGADSVAAQLRKAITDLDSSLPHRERSHARRYYRSRNIRCRAFPLNCSASTPSAVSWSP